jgi:hypothetical protein
MDSNVSNDLAVRPSFALSPVPWGWRDLGWAILLAAGAILALNLGALALSVGVRLPVHGNGVILALFVVVQDLIIVVAAWRFSVARYRVGWGQLGLRGFDAAFGCLTGAALFFLSYVVRVCYAATALGLGIKLEPQAVLARLDTSGWAFFLTLLSAAVWAPVAEEIFFRGFLYGSLRGRIGARGAMIASTFFFTALHFSLDAFIPLFVLGLCLAWLYEKTGSLYPGMILHASNNAVALVALFVTQAMGVKV